MKTISGILFFLFFIGCSELSALYFSKNDSIKHLNYVSLSGNINSFTDIDDDFESYSNINFQSSILWKLRPKNNLGLNVEYAFVSYYKNIGLGAIYNYSFLDRRNTPFVEIICSINRMTLESVSYYYNVDFSNKYIMGKSMLNFGFIHKKKDKRFGLLVKYGVGVGLYNRKIYRESESWRFNDLYSFYPQVNRDLIDEELVYILYKQLRLGMLYYF